MKEAPEESWVPSLCAQCNVGPDPILVHVAQGVALQIEPNPALGEAHPAGGKPCVKAQGLIQKLYNPYRLKAPLKRTNPRKAPGEDPGWVEISWEEALELAAAKLREVRQKGLRDEKGLPRVAITVGNPGSRLHSGTWDAFWQAWGPVDSSLGSGGGVKCYHSEHIYGELWHRAFICSGDTPLCHYQVVFGRGVIVSQPPSAIRRQIDSREKGMKRIQIEPHLSLSGATADEWIPIKPKTDGAFLLAMLYCLLHEIKHWDIPFLKARTNSPYLVGPQGYFLRDAQSHKPLIWDLQDNKAKTFDAPDLKDPALQGNYIVEGVSARPAFQLLLEHTRSYTPEWAAPLCDVPAEKIRRIAREFLSHAQIGATIEIEGVSLPYRPVSIVLGKSVNNGFGSYLCCWASHILSMLVGGLEVPGGHVGVYSNFYPGPLRAAEDGFLWAKFHPTTPDKWQWPPDSRDALKTLCPISVIMGPSHLSYKNLVDPPENLPPPSPPEVWVTFRGNPLVSQWDRATQTEAISRMSFYLAFAYTLNETNAYADLLLPDNTDLESFQLCAVGEKKAERGWYSSGFHLRKPVIQPPFNTRDISDIFTELAERVGILKEYNQAINSGACSGVKLPDSFKLEPERKYPAEEIYQSLARSLSSEDWESGFLLHPRSRLEIYAHLEMEKKGLRYELPYQERLKRIGEELRERLHEKGIYWWDRQCEEYEPLPHWQDCRAIYDNLALYYGKDPEEYDLWLISCRTPLFAWGSNVTLPWMLEVAEQVLGHNGVMLNVETARRLGIGEGEEIWIESPIGRVRGRAILREGVRPEVVVTTQQFGHWLTPFAKEKTALWSNINPLTPIRYELTDETGGSSDHLKVKVYKASPAMPR